MLGAWCPSGGTTCRGDMYEAGLGMSPPCRTLILLYHCGFQQVSQFLMYAPFLIGRGLRGHPHDHGGYRDILASSREDWRFPLTLLDLIIHTVCPCPCTLSIEVLRAGASVVVVCVGLISFPCPGSFQALLVVLGMFPGGVGNQICNTSGVWLPHLHLHFISMSIIPLIYAFV
jgi:hypothetical protein